MDAPASIGPAWRVLPGLSPYEPTVAAMEAHARDLRQGTAGEAVWLLEHAALYTAGTSAREADLLAPGPTPVVRTGRGGQWTWHGPGQRVVYPILDLTRPHGRVPARDVRAYVAGLEAWVIAALARLGIVAERRAGRIGLWVERDGGEAKIAAIGVRLTRWVATHGIAINVHPDLRAYAGIVPCGIAEHGVTSLAELGSPARLQEVDTALCATFPLVFG
jgi:lipoyl(octanoyl) transferase